VFDYNVAAQLTVGSTLYQKTLSQPKLLGLHNVRFISLFLPCRQRHSFCARQPLNHPGTRQRRAFEDLLQCPVVTRRQATTLPFDLPLRDMFIASTLFSDLSLLSDNERFIRRFQM
jgi:hypothetical protein